MVKIKQGYRERYNYASIGTLKAREEYYLKRWRELLRELLDMQQHLQALRIIRKEKEAYEVK